MEQLEGRTAFVTGAASGIGLAIAQELITRGARVVMADINRSALIPAAATLGDAAFAVDLDVTDRTDWARARAAAEAKFGPVDILVNNAGIGSDGRVLADMDPLSFERVIKIDLVGVFNGISTFARSMRERCEGHILNTASQAGIVAQARVGAYAAAKYGVVAMTEVLRSEMEAYGVGVSVLCPGLVHTRLGETTRAAGSERFDLPPDVFDAGADPAMVARRAIEGIRRNTLYIFTHAETGEAVRARVHALLSALGEVGG